MASKGYSEVTFVLEEILTEGWPFRLMHAVGLPDELVDSFPWEDGKGNPSGESELADRLGHPVWFANHIGPEGWAYAGVVDSPTVASVYRRYSFTKQG